MKPDFDKARQYVFARLAHDLSPHLTYHSYQHTCNDVLPAAARLGRASAIGEEDFLLLTTAALFHDTGFLSTYYDHEEQSIVIASTVLPDLGYSASQIEQISGLIAATKMPQRPNGLLQELLCDADLDLLGREDFMHLNQMLLQELRHYSKRPISDETWLRDQTQFLETHHFFTPAAKEMRTAGKLRNLALMRTSSSSRNGSGAAGAAHAD